MATQSPIQIIVYSVKDREAAKKLFTAFLGTEPYVDSEYYVGYRAGEVMQRRSPTSTPTTSRAALRR